VELIEGEFVACDDARVQRHDTVGRGRGEFRLERPALGDDRLHAVAEDLRVGDAVEQPR
jgi:hypothetical protein